MKCLACSGEGYIDLGSDARPCVECEGTGIVPTSVVVTMTEIELALCIEGLVLMTGLRFPHTLRRVGQAVNKVEVLDAVGKLKRAMDRLHEPGEDVVERVVKRVMAGYPRPIQGPSPSHSGAGPQDAEAVVVDLDEPIPFTIVEGGE